MQALTENQNETFTRENRNFLSAYYFRFSIKDIGFISKFTCKVFLMSYSKDFCAREV